MAATGCHGNPVRGVDSDTIGHLLLGLDFIVALNQTVITVSTVGYGEIGDVDAIYKIFTIALVLSGARSTLTRLALH